MPDKKYQIFVSSTYTDLIEERSKLLDTILQLNQIPAGMELFPAIDEEQMKVIKRAIDESDYYVLILGARYGSVDENGISYTEREYEYAIEKGKKVIALIHNHPEKLPPEKTDNNEELRKKMDIFREKVKKKCYVAFWENTYELSEKFIFSFNATVKEFPSIGWVRGDSILKIKELSEKIKELTQERLGEWYSFSNISAFSLWMILIIFWLSLCEIIEIDMPEIMPLTLGMTSITIPTILFSRHLKSCNYKSVSWRTLSVKHKIIRFLLLWWLPWMIFYIPVFICIRYLVIKL